MEDKYKKLVLTKQVKETKMFQIKHCVCWDAPPPNSGKWRVYRYPGIQRFNDPGGDCYWKVEHPNIHIIESFEVFRYLRITWPWPKAMFRNLSVSPKSNIPSLQVGANKNTNPSLSFEMVASTLNHVFVWPGHGIAYHTTEVHPVLANNAQSALAQVARYAEIEMFV